jgi:hypothetical protein
VFLHARNYAITSFLYSKNAIALFKSPANVMEADNGILARSIVNAKRNALQNNHEILVNVKNKYVDIP